jgi:PAS domain S-box-containing protein
MNTTLDQIHDASEASMFKQPHILIIDDDPTYRQILCIALKKQNYIVSAAASSKVAISQINKNDFSVVLIDRILKNASGLDLLQEVKQLKPDTECIIITGHASKDTALEAIQMGAFSYLQKPIETNALRLTIQRAIEKREANRSIKESEHFAHAIIDGLTAHIAILDQDGVIQAVNQAWRDFAEANPPVTANVSEGANYLQVCDQATGEGAEGALEFAQAIRDSLAGKQGVASVEYPCHSPNEKRWFIARLSPLAREGPPYVVVAHEDITERKLAEQLQDAIYKIAQAPAQVPDLKALYQTIHQTIGKVMPSENFFIALWDEENETISYPYFVDEVDTPPPPGNFRKSLTHYILRTGKSLLCTAEIQRELERRGEAEVVGSPSPIWVGVPLLIDGKTIGVMAVQHYSDPNAYGKRELRMLEFVSSQVARAIEQKQSFEALRKSEAFARAVIEHSPIGISVRNKFGRLLSYNQAWQDIFALPEKLVQDDLICEPSELTFTDEDEYLKSYHRDVRNIYEKGGFLHLPELKNDNVYPGAASWISQYFYALKDEHGRVDRVVILTEDITERKAAEEEIRKLNKELEQRVHDRTAELEASNKELESFSYSVSHDLRAPLRAIKGFSTILRENYAEVLDEEGLMYLDRLKASSHKMDRLINDLLALSRLGCYDLSPTSINLTYIAKRVFADLKKEEPDREFHFILTPSPIVFADEHLMEVMLTNLLSNAIKFTRGINPSEIEFGHQENGNGLFFFVRDNGVGFDMKYADKLFSPFQRLHTDNEYEGTGIGLAIVHRIIQRHNGHIWVESIQGQGTTFYFQV